MLKFLRSACNDHIFAVDPLDLEHIEISDPHEISRIWDEAIAVVRPPIAQTLFQQQAVLIAVEAPYFELGMRSQQLLRLAEQRAYIIERAMSSVMNCAMSARFSILPPSKNVRAVVSLDVPRIDCSSVDRLAEIWSQTTALIQPPIAQTLFQQQAVLVSLDDSCCEVAIRHRQLLRLARQWIEKVEKALNSVMSRPIKVNFSVLPQNSKAKSYAKINHR